MNGLDLEDDVAGPTMTEGVDHQYATLHFTAARGVGPKWDDAIRPVKTRLVVW